MKQPKRVIYNKYFEGDDIGEMEGFYEIINGQLEFITGWSLNDAQYRSEYMGGLFNHLGIEVQELPKKHVKQAKTLLRECFGL